MIIARRACWFAIVLFLISGQGFGAWTIDPVTDSPPVTSIDVTGTGPENSEELLFQWKWVSGGWQSYGFTRMSSTSEVSEIATVGMGVTTWASTAFGTSAGGGTMYQIGY
jgi:hypothetical protein